MWAYQISAYMALAIVLLFLAVAPFFEQRLLRLVKCLSIPEVGQAHYRIGPRMRLAILTSHPIQYYAPLFRELARKVDLCVYFAHRATAEDQASAGFGRHSSGT